MATLGLGLAAGRPSESRKSKALAALADNNESKMIRVNFDLSASEHTRLKVYAAKERKSISDVLRELIAEKLGS